MNEEIWIGWPGRDEPDPVLTYRARQLLAMGVPVEEVMDPYALARRTDLGWPPGGARQPDDSAMSVTPLGGNHDEA